jgi:hypothetical protein
LGPGTGLLLQRVGAWIYLYAADNMRPEATTAASRKLSAGPWWGIVLLLGS